MNRRKCIVAAALLGSAAVLVVVSSSFGRGGATEPQDRKLHPQPRHVTAAADGAGIAAAAKGVKVRYLESDATPLGPGASDGYSFTCPRRTPRAVAGYGGSAQAANAGEIVIADSTPFRKGRSWSIGVKNLSAQPREFYVGVVCVG
jgi:hypothetical protein